MSKTTPRPYSEAFEALRDVYLEDSWVLGFSTVENQARFEIDAVLTPDHPKYAQPIPGEQYCYRHGHLSISGVLRLEPSRLPPAMDASRTEDFGNIDAFRQGPDGLWVAEGQWGSLEARNPEVTIRFDE